VPPEVFDMLGRPAETNLLVISYRDDPDEWLRDWQHHVGEFPAEVGFVTVGEMTRSVSASLSTSGGPSRSPTPDDALPFTATVEDPADLTAIGVRASECLETWAGNGNRAVVVLDSVTGLLDAVSLDRAFEFLHVLAGRVESVDGRAYFLLDPAAHDDRSLSAVRELADHAVGLGDPL
jgi:hypothetical protein